MRISYIKESTPEIKQEIVRMIQFMFQERAFKWEAELKTGQMIPLFKKGDRNECNNYRGICLLSMGNRILGKIMAKRLRWWSEHMNLTDDNQNGFRPGRSTTDATQVIIRIEEDTQDLRKRRRKKGEEEERDGDPLARLLDLRKAYPRVSKPALWSILKKKGLEGKFLNTLHDVHEATTYVVKGRDKDSEEWLPEREG